MNKLFLISLLSAVYSFNASAYMFQFKNLGSSDSARFDERVEQGMKIIKLLNQIDDQNEIEKSAVSISYELFHCSNLMWHESNVKIKRTVLDKDDMFKYACLYLVKAEMTAKLSVSLEKCSDKGFIE